MKFPADLIRTILVVCCCSLLFQVPAGAQLSRKRDDSQSVDLKEIEGRLTQAEEALIEEYQQAAIEVYNAGDKVKAMQLLKRLKQLSPQIKGLEDRIRTIEEELMQENAGVFELDTKKNEWTPVGQIVKDKPFRLQAAGVYRLSLRSVPCDIGGLIIDKDAKDVYADFPLGCLLAVIVTDGKPGKPFRVGPRLEHIPKKDGLLFVKVNVPAGAVCVGRIQIGVSGNILHNFKKK